MTENVDTGKFREEDLRLSEVPVCFRALARFGNSVVGADALVDKLAQFGCLADCENCIVAKALESGAETVSDLLDNTSGAIVKSVRKILSEGSSLIG